MERKSERLITERLCLRAPEARDREDLIRLLKDESISKTYMIPVFDTEEAPGRLADRLAACARAEDRFLYGIFLRDRLIGFVNDCGIRGGSIELGYVIAPEQQGRGYATEALRACIAELFRMGFSRVTAGYFEENPASRRVMEKCGMRRMDGEETVEYRGRVHRCLYMSIEKTE